MPSSGDWAEARAREWLERKDNWGYPIACPHDEPPVGPQSECPVCLAALLVEVEDRCVRDFTSEEPCPKCGLGVSARCYGCMMVEQRQTLLAEVRRVVSEIGAQQGRGVGSRDACDEILFCLEKL